MRKTLLSSLFLLAGFILEGAPLLFGSTLQVVPVRIELSGRNPNTVLQVVNQGGEPVTVQIHLVGWQQQDTGDSYSETDDIFISPPIAKIAPHARQVIRIALRNKDLLVYERTYRVFIEEVPGLVKSDVAGIHTLLRISVPIYQRPSSPSPVARPVWAADFTKDGDLRVTVSNTGNIHFVVNAISVAAVGADPVSIQLSQAVLAGGQREWIFRDERLKKATHIVLDADADLGKLHEEITPQSK